MLASRSMMCKLFIRVCRDSNYKIDCVKAAILTAHTIKVHPFEIWDATGSFGNMVKIASGENREFYEKMLEE